MHTGAWETTTEERRRKHPDRRYYTREKFNKIRFKVWSKTISSSVLRSILRLNLWLKIQALIYFLVNKINKINKIA